MVSTLLSLRGAYGATGIVIAVGLAEAVMVTVGAILVLKQPAPSSCDRAR